MKDLSYQIEEIDHTRAEISSRGFYAATNATVRRFRDGQRPFTFLFTKDHTRYTKSAEAFSTAFSETLLVVLGSSGRRNCYKGQQYHQCYHRFRHIRAVYWSLIFSQNFCYESWKKVCILIYRRLKSEECSCMMNVLLIVSLSLGYKRQSHWDFAFNFLPRKSKFQLLHRFTCLTFAAIVFRQNCCSICLIVSM